MNALILFLKGIVAGIGGIAPGLSGSVLLVILGLYERAVHAIGTLFLDFKKNIRFLLPLVAGFGAGILLFSKVVDYLLLHWELYTRFAFLGLIVGTIPLFYREVKKKGFRRWRHMPVIVLSAIAGTFLFGVNKGLFPVLTNATFWQSVLLGVCVAGSSIVPGVDSAAILSALGLYELYVHALAEFNLQILLPAAGGLVIGAVIISRPPSGVSWKAARARTRSTSTTATARSSSRSARDTTRRACCWRCSPNTRRTPARCP